MALEGFEQPNSRDVDPAAARQQEDADMPQGEAIADAQVLPNSPEIALESVAEQEQQLPPAHSRHDSSEL